MSETGGQLGHRVTAALDELAAGSFLVGGLDAHRRGVVGATGPARHQPAPSEKCRVFICETTFMLTFLYEGVEQWGVSVSRWYVGLAGQVLAAARDGGGQDQSVLVRPPG